MAFSANAADFFSLEEILISMFELLAGEKKRQFVYKYQNKTMTSTFPVKSH